MPQVQYVISSPIITWQTIEMQVAGRHAFRLKKFAIISNMHITVYQISVKVNMTFWEPDTFFPVLMLTVPFIFTVPHLLKGKSNALEINF